MPFTLLLLTPLNVPKEEAQQAGAQPCGRARWRGSGARCQTPCAGKDCLPLLSPRGFFALFGGARTYEIGKGRLGRSLLPPTPSPPFGGRGWECPGVGGGAVAAA